MKLSVHSPVSAFNVLAKRPLTRGTAADHTRAFVLTRVEEVVLQALPQGFYKCVVVLQMFAADEAPSWVQAASIAGALVSVAFIVADTDRGIDTNADFRKDHAIVHGYLKSDNKPHAALVSTGTFLMVAGKVTGFSSAVPNSDNLAMTRPRPHPYLES